MNGGRRGKTTKTVSRLRYVVCKCGEAVGATAAWLHPWHHEKRKYTSHIFVVPQQQLQQALKRRKWQCRETERKQTVCTWSSSSLTVRGYVVDGTRAKCQLCPTWHTRCRRNEENKLRPTNHAEEHTRAKNARDLPLWMRCRGTSACSENRCSRPQMRLCAVEKSYFGGWLTATTGIVGGLQDEEHAFTTMVELSFRASRLWQNRGMSYSLLCYMQSGI